MSETSSRDLATGLCTVVVYKWVYNIHWQYNLANKSGLVAVIATDQLSHWVHHVAGDEACYEWNQVTLWNLSQIFMVWFALIWRYAVFRIRFKIFRAGNASDFFDATLPFSIYRRITRFFSRPVLTPHLSRNASWPVMTDLKQVN